MSEPPREDCTIPPKGEDIGLSSMSPHEEIPNAGDGGTTPTKLETTSPSISHREYANIGDTTSTTRKAESPRSDTNGDGLNVSAAECKEHCETPPTDKEPPKPNR